MEDLDLIILGGGSAGFAAAMKANEFGAKTLIVNNKVVGIGGTCVNVGCLPTKYLLHVGEVIHKMKAHNLNGLRASVSFDFKTIMAEKDKLVKEFREEKYEKVLGEMPNVEYLEGDARFLSKTKIQVEGEIYEANKFIIATGSSTFLPRIEGINEVDFLTNKEALNLKELPDSMIILGGGPLGIEFAQIFSRLGTKVCVLEQMDRIVQIEEPELTNLLQEYLENEEIKIITGAEVKKVTQKGREKIVKAVLKGKEETYTAEQLLVTTGRRPNTSNLGLEKMGIRLGRVGEVIVNGEMRAGENVWAAGDVTGEPMLETVAAREGMIAANNALSENKIVMDYRIVPRAVFTDPQLAGVGLTDEQAVKKGIKCNCRTVPMELVPKARAIKDTRGAIKVVTDNETQEIIGLHILAAGAADLIHEGVMIIENRMTIDEVIEVLHIFPTLSESVKIAAQSFRRDITKMSCCAE